MRDIEDNNIYNTDNTDYSEIEKSDVEDSIVEDVNYYPKFERVGSK